MGCKTVDRVVKHIVRIFGHFASVKSLARIYVTHAPRCGHECKLVFVSGQQGSSGDVLYLLSFLENISDKHNYCIFLAPDTPAASIVSLFPSLRKSYYTNRHERDILASVADIRVTDFWPHQPCKYFLEEMLLAFPEGLSPRRYIETNNSDKKVFELFRNLSCKEGRTVLISPHDFSMEGQFLDLGNYWVNYAKELEKKGYVPVFNSSEKFGPFESIFLNYRETIVFSMLAGNIIGVRSGLLDILLYFTDARAIVFYPSKPLLGQEKYILDFRDSPIRRQMEYFSLRKIFPHQDIKECIFNNEYVFWD